MLFVYSTISKSCYINNASYSIHKCERLSARTSYISTLWFFKSLQNNECIYTRALRGPKSLARDRTAPQ